MYNRAKVILRRTKDAEKVKNLQEAVDTFADWLDDYKTHSRSEGDSTSAERPALTNRTN